MTREEAIEAAAEAALIELSRKPGDRDVDRVAGWLRNALAMPQEPRGGFAGRLLARFRAEPDRVWSISDLRQELGDQHRIAITTTLTRYHNEGLLERVSRGRYRARTPRRENR